MGVRRGVTIAYYRGFVTVRLVSLDVSFSKAKVEKEINVYKERERGERLHRLLYYECYRYITYTYKRKLGDDDVFVMRFWYCYVRRSSSVSVSVSASVYEKRVREWDRGRERMTECVCVFFLFYTPSPPRNSTARPWSKDITYISSAMIYIMTTVWRWKIILTPLPCI